MKRLFSIAIFGIITLFTGQAYAQGNAICGNEVIQQEINNDPYLKARMDKYFEHYQAENTMASEQSGRAQSKTTGYEKILIPVVFHIILNPSQIAQLGDTSGIINRINSQLQVINEDFNALNSDLIAVPAAFQPLVGNAAIGFALAKRDAQGKAKLGIVYKTKPGSFTGFPAQDNAVKRDVQGGSNPWDNTKYLNIWITSIDPPTSGGQILGYGYNNDYALQVYGDAALGGIVIHYLTLGRKTSGAQVFYSPNTEKGRTLTHELGHYFNIWHIWGKASPSTSADCDEDDGIDDTPLQGAANTACPIGKKNNCTIKPHAGGEMYMNYMDYSTDVCTKMFSKGQVDRIRIETAPGGKVYTLTQNPHLAFWPNDVSAIEYNNKVDISPNPNTGNFNIHFYDKYDNLHSIIIANTVGQVVKQIPVADQQATNYNIDITGFSKGVYIVQLHFDQGIISRKVVVQ